jgi:uncharacterized integral membrane protein (TIGR00697 family)
LWLSIWHQIPAVAGDGLVSDNQFNGVFGQSLWIIVGSITAFMVSQLDATIFHFLKQNGNKMIWLRSTGSTVISQLFDSFIVLESLGWLVKWLPSFYSLCIYRLFLKLIIAIALTPLIYLGHSIIEKYFNE